LLFVAAYAASAFMPPRAWCVTGKARRDGNSRSQKRRCYRYRAAAAHTLRTHMRHVVVCCRVTEIYRHGAARCVVSGALAVGALLVRRCAARYKNQRRVRQARACARLFARYAAEAKMLRGGVDAGDTASAGAALLRSSVMNRPRYERRHVTRTRYVAANGVVVKEWREVDSKDYGTAGD